MVLADNLEDYLSSHLRTEDVSNKFSSVLNIVASRNVRNKQFDKGVSQYQAAMSFTEDAATMARLEFNLGRRLLARQKI